MGNVFRTGDGAKISDNNVCLNNFLSEQGTRIQAIVSFSMWFVVKSEPFFDNEDECTVDRFKRCEGVKMVDHRPCPH